MQQTGVLAGEAPPQDDEETLSPEADQALGEALSMVQEKLYDGNVADGIAQALQSAPDPISGLVDQATTLLGVSEELTQGVVPDEAFMMFAIALMGEVVEIGQASGMEITGRDIAEAMRRFIQTAVESMGGDTSQIAEVMNSVNVDEVGAALEQAAAADRGEQA